MRFEALEQSIEMIRQLRRPVARLKTRDPKLTRQIREAAALRKRERLARLAHGAAGSSASAGMSGMVPVFRRIEVAAASAAFASLDALVEEAADRLAEVARSLHAAAESGS